MINPDLDNGQTNGAGANWSGRGGARIESDPSSEDCRVKVKRVMTMMMIIMTMIMAKSKNNHDDDDDNDKN